MNAILFYRQKRRDGGIRTGVEIEGDRLLEEFVPGNAEFDSALEWFVNVRWTGKRLPKEPEEIRAWLLDREKQVSRVLQQTADNLRAGIDRDWPVRCSSPATKTEPAIEITCSSIRLISGQKVGEILLEIARTWKGIVNRLETFEVEFSR